MKMDKHGFIAISAIWYERFLECSRTYGTSEYPYSVWRFYHSLLNLGEDKLAIKDITTKYIEEWTYIQKCLLEKQTEYTTDPDNINFQRKQLEHQNIYQVFDHIVQTIQDSGIGWTISIRGEGYDISTRHKDSDFERQS